MSSDLEQIKLRLLDEYEQGRPVDIANWVHRYPQWREELLDYWTWLRGTPRLEEIYSGPPPVVEDDAGEDALRQATLAVALGRQWLQEPVDGAEDEQTRLGAALEFCRQQHFEQGGKASPAFRRAAVYAWVVSVWQPHRRRISRLAIQKATYLLEGALSLGLFTEHRPKQLGPYDHTARYKDAEPIAARQRWLQVRGAVFDAGENIGKGQEYAQRYLRAEPLARQLLDILGVLSDQELETWATVHAAAGILSQQRMNVTVRGIRQVLADTPEWAPKLSRPNFSDTEMQRALTHLVRLRLVQL